MFFQTGSGTSSNMNANEVIANLASKFAKTYVDPNDDVNMSQSSNDVIPTAIKVSAHMDLTKKLLPALDKLIEVTEKKGDSLKGSVKTGRTHLMDVMPLDFHQELSAWVAQLKNYKKNSFVLRNQNAGDALRAGPAVGTGINAHPRLPSYCSRIE